MVLDKSNFVAKIYLGRVSSVLLGDYGVFMREERDLLQDIGPEEDISNAAKVSYKTPLGIVHRVKYRKIYDEDIIASSLVFKVSGETTGLELLCKSSCLENYLYEKFSNFCQEVSKKVKRPIDELYPKKFFNFKKS